MLWRGLLPDGQPASPPPWLFLLWPLLVLFPRWAKKHPVRWTEVTAEIHFEQRVLYPEVDAPAIAGRPVIYENLSVSYPGVPPPFGSNLVSDPSRFMRRHEIAREILKDPDSTRYPGEFNSPYTTLAWLERHGVNVDQLVKRR